MNIKIMPNLYQRKEALALKIKKLETDQMEEIRDMLMRENYVVSENNNGSFFVLNDMSLQLVNTLEKYVDFCLANNIELKKREEKIEKLKHEHMMNK